MDGGAWWAAVHGVTKSRTRLSNITFTYHFHALEKEMAIHSSTFAWKIPWMEEPGGLQSMGLQSHIRLSNFTEAGGRPRVRVTQHRGSTPSVLLTGP